MILSPDNYAFNPHAVPALLTAVSTLLVGFFVVIRERGSRVSILYFLYALTTFLWLFSYAMARFSPIDSVVLWWARSLHAGVVLLPAALYHFTVVVLQIEHTHRRSVLAVWAAAAFFLVMILFTNALFNDLYHYSWGPYTRYRWLAVPIVGYHALTMIAILRFYWVESRRPGQRPTQRSRARALLVAFCIGYISMLDFLPAVGVPYYPLGAFPMFILLVLITRAIWRYRLVDITPAFAAHQIIDTMSDALLVLDEACVIRLTNRAAVRLFGRSEQDMAGKPVSKLISDSLFLAQLDQVPDWGFIHNLEIVCDRGDRGGITLSLSASVLTDQAGRHAGTVCVVRDITEWKKIEEERLRSQKLESLGVLAGGSAHDFNNMLSGILGNISLARLLMTRDAAETNKRLLEAEKALRWARGLTQQLLTFSRGGAPVRKTILIGALIRDAAEFALRGSGTTAEFHIVDDLRPVYADEGQLRQVIQNIVINADQAMPRDGIIEVRAENITSETGGRISDKPADYVRISVTDRGIGIPREHLQKIFDPYFTTKQKGSGLGLATSYAIVRNHDGFIRVESDPARGTTFQVDFPVSLQEPSQERESEDVSVLAEGASARILIMDDEEDLRHLTADMLRHLGYSVEVARHGQEAISKYIEAREAHAPFDIVVLDLTVRGGLGGAETVQRLLAIDPRVRAIVTSGYSDDRVMSDFKQHGFADVLHKPYTVHDVVNTVRRVLKDGPPANSLGADRN